MTRFFAIALLAAVAPASAFAAPVDNSDVIVMERVAARSPADGAAAHDLAVAYLKAGRVTDARRTFEHILALDNVTLTTPSGEDYWSHALARRALGATALTVASN
jgi:thioredoxin-like negative regulator of GroEL